jgi:hypothetical protein
MLEYMPQGKENQAFKFRLRLNGQMKADLEQNSWHILDQNKVTIYAIVWTELQPPNFC